jgi:hypothetical protein
LGPKAQNRAEGAIASEDGTKERRPCSTRCRAGAVFSNWVENMKVERGSLFLSAMLVAKNADYLRDGGHMDRSGQSLIVWTDLYMFIRIGNINGAVWTNKARDKFQIYVLDEHTGKLRASLRLSYAELERFVERDGIFYCLAE